MTCKHIKDTIKKINLLMIELSNPNSTLYQKSDPLFKKEDIEIERTEKQGWFKSESTEKPVFNPNKATVVNLTEVEKLQTKLDEINGIVESCNCYDDIREQSKEERRVKETLTTQKKELEEKIKNWEGENKKLQETSSDCKIENERNKIRVENAKEKEEKVKKEKVEKEQELKDTQEKLELIKDGVLKKQTEITTLQKQWIEEKEKSLEGIIERSEIDENKVKKLTRAHQKLLLVQETEEEAKIETSESEVSKIKKELKTTKENMKIINEKCRQIAELKVQMEKDKKWELEFKVLDQSHKKVS